MGVHNVFHSKIHDKISALSNSFLWDEILFNHGLRLSNSFCMSDTFNSSQAGHQSIMAQRAIQCDSQNVVTLKFFQKVFIIFFNTIKVILLK